MTNENNGLEPSIRPDRRAFGRRKLDLESVGWRARSQTDFTGLPDGVVSHHALLDTFKAAAPALGFSRELVELMDKLFSYTSPADWQKDSRPLVWPSNFSLAEDLDRSPRAIQAQIAALQAAGFLVMKDSPTGRRYGERDAGKKIVLAHSYGFDLSLLAIRHAELVDAARRHADNKAAKGEARRRAFIAKTRLLQMMDTADAEQLWSAYWEELEPRLRSLAESLRLRLTLAEVLHVSNTLEKMAEDAQALLTLALAEKPRAAKDSSAHESSFTLKTHTNDPLDQSPCNSSARGRSGGPDSPEPSADLPAAAEEGREFLTSPAELAELAPPLGAAAGPDPDWPTLYTAAEGLRERIGIPQRAWNMAFEYLGRQGRLITLADLLTFPDSHFTGSRPAYFQAMVNRARRGELRLDRALYGMRNRASLRAADPDRHRVSVRMAIPGLASYQAPQSAGAIARNLEARLMPRGTTKQTRV
jgi:replication initiation protein RepC